GAGQGALLLERGALEGVQRRLGGLQGGPGGLGGGLGMERGVLGVIEGGLGGLDRLLGGAGGLRQRSVVVPPVAVLLDRGGEAVPVVAQAAVVLAVEQAVALGHGLAHLLRQILGGAPLGAGLGDRVDPVPRQQRGEPLAGRAGGVPAGRDAL